MIKPLIPVQGTVNSLTMCRSMSKLSAFIATIRSSLDLTLRAHTHTYILGVSYSYVFTPSHTLACFFLLLCATSLYHYGFSFKFEMKLNRYYIAMYWNWFKWKRYALCNAYTHWHTHPISMNTDKKWPHICLFAPTPFEPKTK